MLNILLSDNHFSITHSPSDWNLVKELTTGVRIHFYVALRDESQYYHPHFTHKEAEAV